MALNFNVLTQVPSFGERFVAGQQAARQEALQNRLLARQDVQFQQQQEDRQREQAREEQFEKMADLIRQNGMDPDDPQVLGQFAQAAFTARQPQLVAFATQMAERAARRSQLKAQTEATRAEMASIFGPQAGAAPAAAAPGMGMPPVTSTLMDEGAARPEARVPMSIEGGAQAMPVQSQGAVTTRDISTGAPPANALAPAAAAPVQNGLITREQVQRGLMSTDPAVRAAAAAMTRTLPPEGRPEKPESPYINVGGALYERATGRWLQPPSVRGEATQSAGVKPPSGYRFTPDGSLEPIPGGPAAVRETAVGTPAQQATAARRERAQSNLSQDLKTQLGYYEELNKIGGMPSPTRSTVENLAAYARSSGLGQEAERAIATRAQTLRDNIKNTRQRLFMQIKDATGATASQMNSNIEMQAWLNSMTDPQQSIETVRETLGQLDSVIAGVREQVERERAAPAQRGAAGGETAPAAGGSGGWSVVR